MTEVIRASGGVVVRPGAAGPEVLVVHRPRYDDWSLPKGKRDPGETDEQCAVREVEEETGVRATLGRELLPSKYIDRHGRPKVVRYWLMQPAREAAFTPNHEIDDARWMTVDEAVQRLSYQGDRDLLRSVRLPFTSGSSASG